MLIIEGPGIGPEDMDRICQEMDNWEASQDKVIEEAMIIILDHYAILERYDLIPEPRRSI